MISYKGGAFIRFASLLMSISIFCFFEGALARPRPKRSTTILGRSPPVSVNVVLSFPRLATNLGFFIEESTYRLVNAYDGGRAVS